MKIVGTFCERKVGAKGKGTFRWKKSGKAWLLLACKKGRRRRGGCQVYKILTPAAPAAGACPAHAKRITKR